MEALEFSFKIDKLIVSVSLGICCQGNSQLSPTTESPPNGMSEVTKWQRGPSHPLATWGSHPEATQEINGQCLPASLPPLNPHLVLAVCLGKGGSGLMERPVQVG